MPQTEKSKPNPKYLTSAFKRFNRATNGLWCIPLVIAGVTGGLLYAFHDKMEVRDFGEVRSLQEDGYTFTLEDDDIIRVDDISSELSYKVNFETGLIQIHSMDINGNVLELEDIIQLSEYAKQAFIDKIRKAGRNISERILKADNDLDAERSHLKNREDYQDIINDARQFIQEHQQNINISEINKAKGADTESLIERPKKPEMKL